MGCFLFRRYWLLLFPVIIAVFLSGCLYSGPRATPSEINAYREELLAKAVRYKVSLWRRVCKVGYRLLSYLPKRFQKGPYPYLGCIVLDSDYDLQVAYHLPRGRSAVLVATIEGSSAENLDIIPGSIILSINNTVVRSYRDYKHLLSHIPVGSYVLLRLWRFGEYQRYVKVDGKFLDIDFYMSSDPDINAVATENAVIVTYGMMNFIKSDDELAVVIGHEIAHILLAHHKKSAGLNMVTSFLGAVIGAKLDEVLPGLGGVIANVSEGAVENGFSRELERQADYWGLYLAYRAGYDVDKGKDIWERFAIEVPDSMTTDFWRSHPSSVERRVYIEKIIKQFKAGIFPDNGNTAN